MYYNHSSYPFRYIKQTESDYPKRLTRYSNMPAGFYLKGSLPDPTKKSVAIIGARKCSLYGQKTAYHFAKVLAEHDVQIISGLANGIDSYAHKGCLDGHGKTFAVLGCGIDKCYPPSNLKLYQSILDNEGGIISEYEPGTPALPYHFPIRNRIISALSDLVLVIEARVKSGSLITASYALDQGIQIYAVPGKITDSMSAGTNSLIFQGAVPAISPEVLLFDLGILNKEKEETPMSPLNDSSLSEIERKILTCLSDEPASLDTICSRCTLSIGPVSAALLQLEIKGKIHQPVTGLYTVFYG